MGAQGKTPPGSNSMQRVKVYRLTDNGKWDDQGTGHVTIDYLESSEDLGLIVVDEDDNETLLVHRISSDEIYRRQEETIISWRDPNLSTDLALSFQESAGCSYVWDHIVGVQRDLQFSTLGNIEVGPRPALDALEASTVPYSNDERFHGAATEIRKLPSLEQSTLPAVLKAVVECGFANQPRVAELILQENDFIPRLMELFRMSEDLEDMDNLYLISKLVKGIILLNNPQILEKIFADEFILDIVGALEYDPEVPQIQKHRDILKKHVVFKEVIPIKGSVVLSKIHQTYRINYIKDVILPRELDEPTIMSLNSIINSNNVLVVSSLKDDTSFIHEVFTKVKSSSSSMESKKNLVLFLQEFCSLSKSLQLVQQLRLFRDLASEGVFDIITDALQSHDKDLISAGTDILILFLNQDPNLLRTYVTQQEGLPLLGILVKGMITDIGEDMHCQFLEMIRILLDSYTSTSVSQRETIIEIFYENHLDQLIDVITASCASKNTKTDISDSFGKADYQYHATTKPEILSNICELLCFCVLHHPYRIKCNFLLNNVIEKVLHLTRRRERYLVVAAVRFMRTIISCKDDYLLRHIVRNNLLKPVIDAFVRNGNRYNMLHSGVLDLLEYISKENIKSLIKYVVESFWDQLSKFDNLGTIQTLKIKYEQTLEVFDAEVNNNVSEPRKRASERGLEKEEEDYFNGNSDEEDSASVVSSKSRPRLKQNLPNGTGISQPTVRSVSGGLVDYDDDDDEDYNPPPRKSETAAEDDTAIFPLSKHKLASPRDANDKDAEIKKKRKLNNHRNEIKVVAVACSTSSAADSQTRQAHQSDNSQDNKDNSKCSKQRDEETDSSVPSATSEDIDVKDPSSEEGHPLKPVNSNSSSEVPINAKVANTGPYPVR